MWCAPRSVSCLCFQCVHYLRRDRKSQFPTQHFPWEHGTKIPTDRGIFSKFRSMCQDAERDGPRWADADDGRCTRFGAFLRRTRLDELPQIWNILKGDMSFVGPRPERACFYRLFEEYIVGFSNRLAVTPGLTGYAQVNGGYDLKPEEKIVYDMEYIEHRSVWMDLLCILKTIRVVFCGDGAR